MSMFGYLFFLHDTNGLMFPCNRFIDFVAVIVEHFAIGSNSNLRGWKKHVSFNHFFVAHGTQSVETQCIFIGKV